MFSGFDYGPYIDPVLLDLCLKLGILGVAICVLFVAWKAAEHAKKEFARIQPPEAVPEQVRELKRQIALHVADVETYRTEIGHLRLVTEEQSDEFHSLFDKYVDLLHKVEEMESDLKRTPHISKISVTTQGALKTREPTLPPLPPTNPKSLTKLPVTSERVRTLKLPVIKKPIPRED